MTTEQQLEDAAIGWFGELGWHYVNGPEIAPDGAEPARSDFCQTVLRERLLTALTRINPHIPAAALEQAAHELLTVSDGFTARLGSLTTNQERMLPWRVIANEDDRPLLEFELKTLVRCFSITCVTSCCSNRITVERLVEVMTA